MYDSKITSNNYHLCLTKIDPKNPEGESFSNNYHVDC